MKRNYEQELQKRVDFIRDLLKKSGAEGIVYGNSGGKDSALVGILCKKACDQVLALMMPCESRQNYEQDMQDARLIADQYGIETKTIDLTELKAVFLSHMPEGLEISSMARANIAPRLRMAALYAAAQSLGYLVAGTGNRSETYMGYFTKWGDGACDFNPISDLTVTEVYEFLEYLDAPRSIRTKAPSAGLYPGQTDEKEMGVTYRAVDEYLLYHTGDADVVKRIEAAHQKTEHKRKGVALFHR